MSIKTTVRTAMATLTIVGGVSTAAALPASAATPACGPSCLSVFSSELGTYAQPNFVEHVFGGKASVGQPTGLNQASGSDPSEDFINPHPGSVSDYYAMGMVSAAVNRHYGTLTASQLEYDAVGNAQRTVRWRRDRPVPGRSTQLAAMHHSGQDRLDHRYR